MHRAVLTKCMWKPVKPAHQLYPIMLGFTLSSLASPQGLCVFIERLQFHAKATKLAFCDVLDIVGVDLRRVCISIALGFRIPSHEQPQTLSNIGWDARNQHCPASKLRIRSDPRSV